MYVPANTCNGVTQNFREQAPFKGNLITNDLGIVENQIIGLEMIAYNKNRINGE